MCKNCAPWCSEEFGMKKNLTLSLASWEIFDKLPNFLKPQFSHFYDRMQ